MDQIRSTPKTLTVELRFPPHDPMSTEFEESLSSVVTLVMDIIDYIGQCGKLSATVKKFGICVFV